jgi:ABC-type Mn2+/Zn2+ transport system permease subunit
VYLALRRMSYIGHGLSHAVFGGTVVSFLVQVNFNEVALFGNVLGITPADLWMTVCTFATMASGITQPRHRR